MSKKEKVTKSVLLHLRLSPPEAESLKRLTRHLGMTQSAVVRWLVTREAGRIEGAKGGQNGNL
jgi:predicted DNA-binding protein